MKFITLLISTGLIALASAQKKYCNRGTAGDNSCERDGLHTFCCKGSKGGEYVHEKNTNRLSNGPDGSSWCGAPIPEEGTKEGVIYCAS